jgi:hypothetical protein
MCFLREKKSLKKTVTQIKLPLNVDINIFTAQVLETNLFLMFYMGYIYYNYSI